MQPSGRPAPLVVVPYTYRQLADTLSVTYTLYNLVAGNKPSSQAINWITSRDEYIYVDVRTTPVVVLTAHEPPLDDVGFSVLGKEML